MLDNPRLLAISLSVVLCLTACRDTDTSSSGAAATPFFDLKAYFDEQIEQLNQKKPTLVKRVQIGDEVEKKTVENTDFEKELEIFRRSDINRPTWLDKYSVDSIFAGEQLNAIQYSALDSSLNTRLLKVYFRQGVVDSIRIHNQTHSPIADTRQDLLYCPGRNYQIQSKQKTMGREPREVAIHVAWNGDSL